MDNLENNILFWIITTGITSLSSIILGTITWIKSVKIMPKEITKAQLENKQIELSIVDQFDEIARKAALRVLDTEERLTNIEEKNSKLEEKLELQGKIIEEQASIIKQQSMRLDQQEIKTQSQNKKISTLTKELKLAQAYNAALLNQIRKENITPIDLSSISIEDYENGINNEEKEKKIYKSHTDNK